MTLSNSQLLLLCEPAGETSISLPLTVWVRRTEVPTTRPRVYQTSPIYQLYDVKSYDAYVDVQHATFSNLFVGSNLI